MNTHFPSGKRLLRAIALVVAALGLPASPHLQAQTVNPLAKSGFDFARDKTAIQEAYVALKLGDATTALAKISANLRTGPRAAHADLQVGSQLARISSRLKNEGDHARTVQVAALALGALALPQGRMPAKDAVASLTLAGQLYDHVLGDPVRARQAYEQALAADPTLKPVAERLAYLQAVEDNARAKMLANDLLRQRNAQPRR